MSFFSTNKKIHPLVAMFTSITVALVGLILAKTWAVSVFLGGVFVLYCTSGWLKMTFKMVLPCAIVSSIFFGIMYGSSGGDLSFGVTMVNRIAALFLAVIPGISTEPVRMVRSLSQIHTPRAVTLGALITMSFIPLLQGETRRVREAMKTRGAGSLLNPKIFYRAFLVPFIMRLINISDTLAFSVETRGFTLDKDKPYSVYKKEVFGMVDIEYLVFLIGMVVAVSVCVSMYDTTLASLASMM